MADEKREHLLQICEEHVQKGIEHVLGQNLDVKRDILKYIFNHAEAKTSLRVPRANRLLEELMTSDGDNEPGEGRVGKVATLYVSAVVDIVNSLVDQVEVMHAMPKLPAFAEIMEQDGEEESATGTSAARRRFDSVLDDLGKGKINGFEAV